ncbi:MAG: hypothetical protein FJ388_19005, partial [Verrucomicrobia bacterium]|nr:hypothetical protein [Verrucomicrobiota bacterium]
MSHFIRDHLHPTLALKLGFLVLASTGVIYLLAFFCGNQIARGLLHKAVEENTRNLARSTVHQIEAVLRAVEPLPQWLALRVASGQRGEQEITRMLQNELRSTPHIYGSAVAFAPGEYSGETNLFAPYVFRKEGRFQFVNLGVGAYDYCS